MEPLKEAMEIKKLREKGMTQFGIAGNLKISQTQVSQRLSLLDLIPELQEALGAKKIPVVNAYALAKQPFKEQQEWLRRFRKKEFKACPHCGFLN